MPSLSALRLVISSSTSTHRATRSWSVKRDQWYRNYRTDKCWMFWAFALALTWNTAMQSFHTPSNYVWLRKALQFSRQGRNGRILIIWVLSVTWTLRTANQSFHLTLRLKVMHPHIKFDYKWLSDLEDIAWTNIHRKFETLLCPWPGKQQSHFHRQRLSSCMAKYPNCASWHCKSQYYCQHMTTLIVLGSVISNGSSSHVVWLKRYQWYRKYMTDKDSMKF